MKTVKAYKKKKNQKPQVNNPPTRPQYWAISFQAGTFIVLSLLRMFKDIS